MTKNQAFCLSIFCQHSQALSSFHDLFVLQLEESHGFCDPNPTEYIDIDSADPNMVFYWGLQVGKNHNMNLSNMTADFMMNISTGYEGPIGNMELSVVKASELPKMTGNKSKTIKACLGTVGRNQQQIPLYSHHAPNYVVGYMATASDENEEYPDSNIAAANDENEEEDIKE